MKQELAASVLLALLALPAWADTHPRSVGERDPRRGYEWVAASSVLTASGSVKTAGVHDRLRRGLEWQLLNGAAAMDLENGGAPSDEQCAPPPPWAAWPMLIDPEQDWRFASVMLLAEEIVTATVEEAIPGFYRDSNPGVLLELSDVAPLHGRSPWIRYVLAPVKKMVANGRIFCEITGGPHRSSASLPDMGARVVVLGPWSQDRIVQVGTFGHLGLLATVDRSGDLQWKDYVLTEAPGNLDGLRQRLNEATAGGLFDMTSHLVRQPYGSDERREFVKRWRRYESDGCRVVAVASRPDIGVVPVRKLCGETGKQQ